jgi:flagellar biosynthesis protein FliR
VLPLDFPKIDITIYLLVAVRVTAAMMSAPILGSRQIPVQIRIGLGLVLTLCLAPVVPTTGIPTEVGAYAFAVVREAVLGLLLGFGVHFIFLAFDAAAGLIGIQMGLSQPTGTDPVFFGDMDIPLKRFFLALATVIFFLVDGPDLFVLGLHSTFVALPVGEPGFPAMGGEKLLQLLVLGVVSAIRIAVPMIGTLLLADVGLALAARTAPQFNLFAVGIPIKVALGFFALALCLPSLTTQMASAMSRIPYYVTYWAR